MGRLETFLQEDRFDYLSQEDRAFVLAFDEAMEQRGYGCGDVVGGGYCWGRYMVIYTKVGVKSKKVTARLYLRDDGVVLRLFFSGIDKHRAFLEAAPPVVKEVFTGENGACGHCGNDHNGVCKFRKTYTLDGRLIEKCNGRTFEFYQPDLNKLPAYLAVYDEFYPSKRK